MTICSNCGRTQEKHLNNGSCPKPAVSITIDAASIERVALTGHPRLLANVIQHKVDGVMHDVAIAVLDLKGSSQPSSWQEAS
jgi:hypothetical protein